MNGCGFCRPPMPLTLRGIHSKGLTFLAFVLSNNDRTTLSAGSEARNL